MRLKPRQKIAELNISKTIHTKLLNAGDGKLAIKSSKKITNYEFIVINLILALVLGWQLRRNLFAPDQALNGLKVSYKTGERAPSSINESTKNLSGFVTEKISSQKEPLSESMLSDLANLDGHCSKSLRNKADEGLKTGNFKSNRNIYQFKGKRCLKNSQIKISNSTNGFEATIFFINEFDFQSDLIQLVPGENKIQIEWTAPNGSVQHRLVYVEFDSNKNI